MKTLVTPTDVDATKVSVTIDGTLGEFKELLKHDDPKVPWPLRQALKTAIRNAEETYAQEVQQE